MIVVEGAVDSKGMRSIETLVQDGICRSAEYYQRTESTNTVALQNMRGGVIDESLLPKCYLADEQTAGRGRHGRRWISSEGTLTFSLVMERPTVKAEHSGLESIAVGVGIARSLEFEFAPLRCRLKWPNDVHVGGGKVAGVLLETLPEASGRVVIGVGVNVANEPDLSAEPGGRKAQSLTGVIGRNVLRYDMLISLVTQIVQTVDELSGDPVSVLDEYRSRCLLTGNRIAFQQGAVERHGVCDGISDRGELVVKTETGSQLVQSGEARLVRVQDI